MKENLEAETRASAQALEERDAIQREFHLKEAEIVRLSNALEHFRLENLNLGANQTEMEAKNKQLEQSSATLSARYDLLVQEFEAAKKLLVEMDQENAQLSSQLQAANEHIEDRLKEIGDLEAYRTNAQVQLEHYDKECKRAEAERELLESQLDKLDKEVEQVRAAAAGDRQSSEKILRENRQLHVQLHEHLSNSMTQK